MKGQSSVATQKSTAAIGRAPVGVLQRQCACGQHTQGEGECQECKKEERMPLQRYASGLAAPAVAPPIVHDVLRSPGRALDQGTQAYFGSRFGHDFSQVRVHNEQQAAESARAVGALAYTVGNNVVFGAGRYSPSNITGRRLLAHELTHVVQQQNGNGSSPQYRLEVGPSQDRFEREANRMASRMEAGQEEGSCLPPIHLPPTHLPPNSQLTYIAPRVQRAAAAGSEPQATGGPEATPGPRQRAALLLVEDDARDAQPGQMRKGEFLDKLQTSVCATADEVLSLLGRTAKGCPFIAHWIGRLRSQSSQHIERAIRKYVPESAGVSNAQDYVPMVAARVRRGVMRWITTGKISEVPEELRGQLPGPEGTGAADRPLSGNGEVGGVHAKERAGGVHGAGQLRDIQAQLQAGHSLDGGVKSRMEAAFGHDFSRVRIHTDSPASQLSTQLNARAFTIGSDVAFGPGEYQPGTLIGDALLAHELAHVIQQRTESIGPEPLTSGGPEYDALEEQADALAVNTVASLWSWRPGQKTIFGKDTLPRLKSRLRLQRCGGDPDKVNLRAMSAKQREQFAKEFIQKNFPAKDQASAGKILDDMLQSDELSFKDENALKTEIFKRMETATFMKQSQELFGVAFEYPNKPAAKACIPNNKEGRINPRVNKAAEPYWGPVEDPQGNYHFKLSEAGKQNAYRALTTLFTRQKSICDMTLIHCDYLASVVHFRAFAESIGIEEFNKRVKNGDIDMRLAWNGFQELEDIGWSHSKKSISLREVRPANENDLVIGDHVIFWNHRAYDWLNEVERDAWRLENAILVSRSGKEDHFLGHGSGNHTNDAMREILAGKFNTVVDKAQGIIDRTKSRDPATASAARAEIDRRFPKVKKDNGQWVITGGSFSRSFKFGRIKATDPDLVGLRDLNDSSKMGCVKRPSEAPGDSC